MASIYDPSTYPQGVPNPYGPRVHAWKGGPLNEGTRFHGPVYTRPQASFPWHERPVWSGTAGTEEISPAVRTVMSVGSTVGTVAGAYHGYKRNNSVGWAIAWALLGGIFWPIALPVMFAQGFGEKK